jgi:hypothetical protein
MIEKKTVLIIGAGGSMCFNFPSGIKLVKDIVHKLSGDELSIQRIEELGFNRKQILEFKESLKYSGAPSVDSFLETRVDYLEIGKAAIAQVLLPYEKIEPLFFQNSWLSYVFNKMNVCPFENIDKNEISFITFNYDRVIEHYFYNALMNKYGKSEQEVIVKMKKINIIHLYGQLGYLPWQQQENVVPFGLVNNQTVKNAADNINIVHDKIDINKRSEFIKTYELLKAAQKVYFLGFGFHPINLERLKLWELNGNIEIAGTLYRKTPLERTRISRLTNGVIKEDELYNFTKPDNPIIDFFRENKELE